MLTANPREIITPANLIEAFHNYHNHLALSVSPLANLASVRQRQQDTSQKTVSPSPQGAALATELKSLIASLEPKDAQLPSTHPRRYAYEVLHQTVVLGRSATDTASRLYISRSQLYRIREKAIADLCQLWQERELRQFESSSEFWVSSSALEVVSSESSVQSPASKTISPPSTTTASEAKVQSSESETNIPPVPERRHPSSLIPASETLSPQSSVLSSHKDSGLPTLDSGLMSSGFRIVNVLVANLSGFNRFTSSVDLETAHDLLGRMMAAMDQVLKEADGYVNQWYDRGVSAFLGAPISHEDDPVRAVRAALRLQSSMLELRDSLPELSAQTRKAWPALKIGIGRGRVFAGIAQPGHNPANAATSRYTVTGQALGVATDLVETAPAGWILIDHQTYRQVRGLFEIEALQTSGVEHSSAPAEAEGENASPVYRVLKERPQGFLIGVRDVQGVEVNMVGREPEWNMLTGLYQESASNQTVRQLTVVGGAGSGKSRLEYEFRKYLEIQPGVTRYWHGQAVQEGRLPYQPFAEMLGYKAAIEESDSADQARLRLLELCRPLFGDAPPAWNNPAALEQGLTRADEVAHLLSVILDLSWPDSPFLEALSKNSPQVAQSQTFRAFADLCERVASGGDPLVLVLEDLHWAQETTLALWNYLSTDLAEAPVLLLGLTRPELYERKPDWGLGLDRHIRLDLKPLSPARTRELIRHILRKVEALPDSLIESIVLVADGNPFYIEEIVKMLIADGLILINEVDGTWKLKESPEPGVQSRELQNAKHPISVSRFPTLDSRLWTPDSKWAVPGTIEGLIQARMDRLPAFERQLIGLAAVAGRDFSTAALEHLLSTIPSKPAETENLTTALRRLQQRELIVRKPERTAPGSGGQDYLFRHSLLREIVYNNMPQKVRAPLHLALADWLSANRDRTERRSEEGSAVAIAEHYERAGLSERAAQFYEEAGEEARVAYALAEAVENYRKALSLLSDKGEPLRRVRLLEKKGQAETALGRYPAGLADFAAALQLLPAGETEYRAELQLQRGEIFWRQGAYAQGLEEATAAEKALATKQGASWARLHTLVGSFHFRQGRYDQAEKIMLEALAELETAQNEVNPLEQERNRRALAECCRNLGIVDWGRGDLKPAAQRLEQSLALNRQLGDQFNIANCLEFRGLVHRDAGEFEQAINSFRQARAIFHQLGDQQRSAYCNVNLGIIAWRQGQLDKAKNYFERGLAVYEPLEAQFGIASCYNSLGILARDRGELSLALQLLDKSIRISEKINDRRGLGYSYIFKGIVHHEQGALGRAAEFYEQGLAIRKEVGHQIGIGESYMRLGRLYLDRGDFEQARTYSERSLEIFQKIGLFGLPYTYNNLTRLSILQGDYPGAAESLEAAIRYSKELDTDESLIEALLNRGRLDLVQGQESDIVVAAFTQAIELAAGRYPLLIASAHLGQAELWLRENQPQKALEAVLSGKTFINKYGLNLLVARTCRLQAVALRRLGQLEASQEALGQSRAAALASGQQYELELIEREMQSGE